MRGHFGKLPTGQSSAPDLEPHRYHVYNFLAARALKPTLHNLSRWLTKFSVGLLKPAQKYQILKINMISRMFHGLRAPVITSKNLCEIYRLCRHYAKKILHLSEHTDNQFLSAKLRDSDLGSLGMPYLRHQTLSRLI